VADETVRPSIGDGLRSLRGDVYREIASKVATAYRRKAVPARTQQTPATNTARVQGITRVGRKSALAKAMKNAIPKARARTRKLSRSTPFGDADLRCMLRTNSDDCHKQT